MSAPSAEALPAAAGPSRGTPPGEDPGEAWSSRLARWDLKVTPYLLIAPFYLLFLAVGMFPIAYNVLVSMQRYRLDESEHPFIGLDNYRRLFTKVPGQTVYDGSDFWDALVKTLGLFVGSSAPQILAALALAALLNRKLKFQTLFRIGVLVPYIVPITASTLVFRFVFQNQNGLVNNLLEKVGLDPINWKANIWSSWIAIITMVDWRWTGYWTVIFLAAMQSISRDLYEAATVDGAGPVRQFWQLTVPLLRPTLIFAVVMSSIGGLQLFAEPLLYGDNVADARGGSLGQFETVQLYIYRITWKQLNLGYGAALSIVLFFIIIAVAGLNALVTNRLGRRK
ncbi:MAG: sugar ABC transporter permease [Kineosporiaceae bacterium]